MPPDRDRDDIALRILIALSTVETEAYYTMLDADGEDIPFTARHLVERAYVLADAYLAARRRGR